MWNPVKLKVFSNKRIGFAKNTKKTGMLLSIMDTLPIALSFFLHI